MKKIIGIILLLVAFAFTADYRPFNFSNIPNDSALQQDQYDYMLQYKLYGTDYIKMGRRVIIPDKSGWNGSSGPISSAEGISLGGPVLTDSTITLGDQCQFTTGPIRAKSLTTGNDNEQAIFAGNICLTETPVAPTTTGISRGEGKLSCDSVPPAPVNLSMPTITWPSDGYQQDIILTDNYQADTIEVPEGEGQYDLYFKNIWTCVDGKTGCKIYIHMTQNRLTRIFVDSLFIGNHTTISVILGDSVLPQSKYRGNVLIYSNKDIIFDNTDNVPIQGSFITTAKMYLKCNLDFAGQMLANKLEIGDDFKGENFRFVKFDPDTLDFPELNKQGGLKENDSTVIIPIKLSDTATIDVYFTYCFEFKDGVTLEDFNMPPYLPICGDSTVTTKIPIGQKSPLDTIKINVKVDDLTETNDILVMKIDSISGAVLPGGETSGELPIKIIDADVKNNVEFDTTHTYKFEENKRGFVDSIKVLHKTETTRFYLDSAYTDRYTLDSLTGVLTLFGDTLNYEKAITDVIKVTLKDTGNVSITRNLPISVIDVNEAPTINDVSIDLKENNVITKSIDTLIAIDVDIKSEFTQNVFSLLEGDTSIFRLDADGELWAKKTFDYEADQKTYTLKVLVQDKNDPTLKDSAIVTVNITNSNDSPKFDKNDTTFYVDENKPFKDSVKATDQDGDKLTYTIVGNVPFKIDNNGVITSTRTFDYEKETEFTFKVVVSDGTLKDTMNVSVKINDENEPVHVRDTIFSINEDTTGVLGTITAWDEDGPRDTIKFTLSDSINYNIDSTGKLTLVNPFDFETKEADTITVYVNTKNGDKDSAKVIINIKDVNEPPVLQPNDTLKVPENCDTCFIGIITAIDPDKNDTLSYSVKEPGFKIDSTGKLTTTKPFDHETTPTVTITVVVKDKADNKDTLKYVITITNVNEPVHVDDKTCTIKENYVGNVCQIPATDEDKDSITYIVIDNPNYEFKDDTLVIKNPIDYEKKTKDTVKVIVTDGNGNTDTATIVINIIDEKEDVKITAIDNEPKKDTIKTNDPNHNIEWKLCEGIKCDYDTLDVVVKKDTIIKVCNEKKTVCDSVVILFNDAPPVVTLTNAKSTDALIDYITIEEEKDDKIYVNKKNNEITVTVKDTIHKTEKHFNIDVTLDTVSTKDIKLTEYNYIIDETKAKVVPIGNNLAELVEIIKVDGVEVELKQVIDTKTGKPVDTVQTVTYTKKVNGKDVVVSYKTDNLTGQKIGDYEVSYMIDSCTKVTYSVDDNKKIVKNKEGNIAYTIAYEYTDDYGNKASAKVEIIFDNIPPKVEILNPTPMESFNTNAIPVKWTVNGEVQDTLTLQRLEKGVNHIIRRYVDKAGNVAEDTITVIMKEAKDIDITLVHPVTKVDKDKVDEYYSEGHKYNDKKPYDVKFVDPKNDSLPEVIGVGFKVDIVLPSVSPTGSLATLDDIVKNGMIPVDDKGNIVGASTKGIPVETYVAEHCTDEFKEDYKKNGLNIPLYDVTYNLHLWVYTNNANYVNDFNIEFTLNDEAKTTSAGTVQMVIDWLSDKDGNVKAKNGHALGTGAYITKLWSKSIAKHRCDYKEQKKGDRTVKKDDTMKIFGYKRPNDK